MSEQSESKDKANAQLAELLIKTLLSGDKTTLEEAVAVANQAAVISGAVSSLLEESKKLMQLSKSHDDMQVCSMLVTGTSALRQAVDQERKRWDARAKVLAAPKP